MLFNFLILINLFLSEPQAEPVVLDRLLASVEDTVITQSDFNLVVSLTSSLESEYPPLSIKHSSALDYLIQLHVIGVLAKDNPVYKPSTLELDQTLNQYSTTRQYYSYQELNDFFVLKLTAEKYMLSNLPLDKDSNKQRIDYRNWYENQLKRVSVKTVKQ